ncbi:outer membrane protein assembly factor BamD [Ichthyobacterium seriolicida]|uniref:Outer membrane assembly lipoprotein YfiO n=1 Tax=Ichthyobacterium seriolicida TaxID=242600 RepID=A0A1J1E9R9_9FLAO|nr:outer membrane protein assembly factor BamD [Ichthyobacterium seriolicida]BAV94272.1 outer membrane assembly lipoprotein YfiO [Ichthyobacterium seriolicida]
MIKNHLYYCLFILVITLSWSCASLDDVLNSSSLEEKEKLALKYYNEGDYETASMFFENILPYYRGLEKMEEFSYYNAMCSYNKGYYIVAAEQLKNFEKNFPHNENAQYAAYLSAYCYYLDSPKYYLDQESTHNAIPYLQKFTNKYPNSKYVEECNKLMSELREKIEKKAFENAKIYYSTKKYKAAVVALGTVLNDYPGNKFTSEIYYYRAKSAYELAVKSIESKKKKRFIDLDTACKLFIKHSDKENKNYSKWMEEISDIHYKAIEYITLN